jgi:putative NADPH-quinone reductase
MPRKILIINGHPDASRLGLCHALAAAYAEGATDAGHEVRRLDIAKLDFDLLRSQSAFENEPPPPIIASEQVAIRWADHLVVIFPLWLGDMPAVLKAFFEQALRPGFAFSYRASGLPIKHLKGRSARIIVTMGMPALVYRWIFGAHGVKNLKRNILRFVGFGPVRSTLIGRVGTRSGESIGRTIDAVRDLGDRAA